jgi:hypothetical protein
MLRLRERREDDLQQKLRWHVCCITPVLAQEATQEAAQDQPPNLRHRDTQATSHIPHMFAVIFHQNARARRCISGGWEWQRPESRRQR